uniref:Uncharacterized protein n=1 Tax=Meloidogyne javanica TaxID=6303 RepID=A0A915M1P8_MELJA
MLKFKRAKEKKVDFVGTRKEEPKSVMKINRVTEEHENKGVEELDDGARLSNFAFPDFLNLPPTFRMVGEQDAKVKSDDMSSFYSTLGVEMPKREFKESTDTNLPTPPAEGRIDKGGNIPPPIPPPAPPADRKDKYKRPEVENVSDALRELKYYIEEKSGFENDIAHHEDILFKEALDIFPEWNMKKISSQLSKLNEESENGRNEEKKGELIDKVGSMIETPQVLDSVDKIVIELTKQLVENSRKPEELKMKSSNPLEMLWAATSLVEFRVNKIL